MADPADTVLADRQVDPPSTDGQQDVDVPVVRPYNTKPIGS